MVSETQDVAQFVRESAHYRTCGGVIILRTLGLVHDHQYRASERVVRSGGSRREQEASERTAGAEEVLVRVRTRLNPYVINVPFARRDLTRRGQCEGGLARCKVLLAPESVIPHLYRGSGGQRVIVGADGDGGPLDEVPGDVVVRDGPPRGRPDIRRGARGQQAQLDGGEGDQCRQERAHSHS